MAYIGKSPDGTGVRARYYFTATGGETSLSGADDNAVTLSFSDGAYVDVYLNGVLLVAGTDYNTTTANTISGLAALAANDIVEILVYDIFTVADTVSASAGGTFSGAVQFSGNITGDLAATGHASVGVDAVDATRALTVAGSTDDSSASGLVVYNSSLASKFSVRNDGYITAAGDIQVGGSLYVGGTAAANALDDYEEGTWTPTLFDFAGTPTINNAYYTKIGRQVTATLMVSLDATTDSSQFVVDGLPFTSQSVSNNIFGGFVTYSNGSFADNIYPLLDNNSTRMKLYKPSGGQFTYSDLGASNQIRLNLIYFST